MSYADYPEFEAFQQRRNTTESHTIITSALLGAIIGVFALCKALDILGYPVWHLIERSLQMATDVLRLRGASFGSTASNSSNDDTTQQGSMFGSLFGTSPGNLLQKGVRGVANVFSKGPSDVPPGLGNISNSCYQNSVIQGLASLPSLRVHLSKTTSENPALTLGSTNGALFDIITKLNDPDNKGQHFWIKGKLKSMSTFEQQDAQEYYSKILDALDEEVKKTASSKRRSSVSWLEVTRSLSDSTDTDEKVQDGTKDGADKSGKPQVPSNPLEGRLAQRVGCTSCGYSEGLTLIPFNCITVSLGKHYSYDVRECLDEYTTLEFIDGVECAKCTLLKLQRTLSPLVASKPESPLKARLDAVQEAIEKEDFDDKTLLKTLNVPKKNWVQSTKSKQAVVARAPQSLVLHVNRSSFNEYTGMPFKNTAGVSYPTVLDLGNWCLGGISHGSQEPAASEEEWPKDPRQSMLARDEPITDSPFQYQLRAAVTHYGSHGNGHYVCYRSHPKTAPKPQSDEDSEVSPMECEDAEDVAVEEPEEVTSIPQSEQWWRFSDDSVYPVSEEEAYQGNVFMLFYERIGEEAPLAPHAAPESIPVVEEAPLPPADVMTELLTALDEEAIAIALPDDDDVIDLLPPQTTPMPRPATLDTTLEQQSTEEPVISTPVEVATPQDTETDASDAESEDAPSTQLTSDDNESEADVPTPSTSTKTTPRLQNVSPNLMRTAGNASSRGQQGSGRQSLPLVSAT